MKLSKGNKYWVELEVQDNNKFKVKRAEKYIKVNQYETHWGSINARDLSRKIRQVGLVTN